MRILGLMSGTSADGVDAVFAEFTGAATKPNWKLLNLVSIPYPSSLRKRIIDISQGLKISSNEWIDIAEAITEVYAQAALTCASDRQFEVVGCHGQTVLHRPTCKDRRGASWQILQAPLLAQMLGRPVIYDFRAVDIALGGHGAPLAPKLDAALFGRADGWRVILNLGGIANISLIPPKRGPDRLENIIGWDCGPANSLLDLAIQKLSKEKSFYDKDALIAARGFTYEAVIKEWLKEPFFNKNPPKSTGREQFGLEDLYRRCSDMPSTQLSDLLATLTAFTAAVIAQDLDNLYTAKSIRPFELLVAGGGCRNPLMLQEIIQRCRGISVSTIDDIGVPSEAREALSFALLAWWHCLQYPGNSPYITGARKETVLGMRVDPA